MINPPFLGKLKSIHKALSHSSCDRGFPLGHQAVVGTKIPSSHMPCCFRYRNNPRKSYWKYLEISFPSASLIYIYLLSKVINLCILYLIHYCMVLYVYIYRWASNHLGMVHAGHASNIRISGQNVLATPGYSSGWCPHLGRQRQCEAKFIKWLNPHPIDVPGGSTTERRVGTWALTENSTTGRWIKCNMLPLPVAVFLPETWEVCKLHLGVGQTWQNLGTTKIRMAVAIYLPYIT